jgi:hypothetical protein
MGRFSPLMTSTSLAVGGGLLVAAVAGCTAIAFGAAAIENARAQTNVSVKAEYSGLDGHSFAVLVVADRVTQAENPTLVARFTDRMNERLKDESKATGYIPPMDLLTYTFNNPRWVARPLGQVAEELGVDRLVLVELQEYRLYEPGNRYMWDGTVLGTVGVIEADSPVPDEFVFNKTVRINYPDKDKNYTAEDSNMTAEIVATVLESRFVDRVTWLFYDHKEPYSIEY